MKIAVAGTGYVGLSNGVLLAQHHDVVALDIAPERVEAINARVSHIDDPELAAFLRERPLALHATCDPVEAYEGASYVVVATPTDYNPETNRFDTRSIESVVRDVLAINPEATVVIKSTIPVGYTRSINAGIGRGQVMFSPEFLREGHALHDNLHPSRIVVGEVSARGQAFADLLRQGAVERSVPVLLTGSAEAEAIKLFANTYLAMRVSYFNELDTYAATHGLDTRQIIDGVGLDPRIGRHYNNPSFGYGGYCLPKDTQQLLANYSDVPQQLIRAIVASNATRKDFVAQDILARRPRVVGIYRLIMKAGSDNFRSSSVLDVMDRLSAAGVSLVVHEPSLQASTFRGAAVEPDLAAFKSACDLIVCNRATSALHDVASKVYTRDLFGKDE